MAENCGELEEGQRILKEMIDAGKADAWLAEREVLRKTAGQAAFVTMKKPLRLIALFSPTPPTLTHAPAEHLALKEAKNVQITNATSMQKDGSDETVLHTGFDGKKHEYCPYSETSKNYDQTRAPLGVNVFLGPLAQNGSQP